MWGAARQVWRPGVAEWLMASKIWHHAGGQLYSSATSVRSPVSPNDFLRVFRGSLLHCGVLGLSMQRQLSTTSRSLMSFFFFLEIISVLITEELLGWLAAFVLRLVFLVALRISNIQFRQTDDLQGPMAETERTWRCRPALKALLGGHACPQQNRLTSVFALLWIIGGPKLSW